MAAAETLVPRAAPRRGAVRWRRAAALALAATLAGCASIPLSTMWKLRGFDRATLLQLDPADVRAATSLRPDVPIEPGSTALTLRLQRDGMPDVEHAFALEATAEPAPGESGRWQAWRLDAAGRAAFADVQRVLRAADADRTPLTGAAFDVAFRPAFGATTPDALRLSVQLRLDPADGWFLLVDDHVLPVRR